MKKSSLIFSIFIALTSLSVLPKPVYFYNRSVSFGVSQRQGNRNHMEDFYNMVQLKNHLIFAVFDGHSGEDVSRYASETFPKTFEAHQTKYTTEETLKNSLNSIENQIIEKQLTAGSTAVVAVLDKNYLLSIANIGDSRAVIIRDESVIFSTKDHKPNDPDEKERIENANGHIYWHGVWRVNGFALSRVLGDTSVKLRSPNTIISTPDMYQFEVKKGDTLIIASDGLWDVLPNSFSIEQAYLASFSAHKISYRDKQFDKTEGSDHQIAAQAKKLRDYAYAHGSGDNITVVIVNF